MRAFQVDRSLATDLDEIRGITTEFYGKLLCISYVIEEKEAKNLGSNSWQSGRAYVIYARHAIYRGRVLFFF
jgi:hypothetical protein